MNTPKGEETLERILRIANHQGLHARVATMVVQALQQYAASVTVVKDGVEVDGRSVLGLLLLAATHGAEILVKAQGPDREEAVEHLSRLIEYDDNETARSKGNSRNI